VRRNYAPNEPLNGSYFVCVVELMIKDRVNGHCKVSAHEAIEEGNTTD